MDTYKLYRQLQEKEKRYKNYDNYDREDLIDIILDNEEKQEQLISFLENKIKDITDYGVSFGLFIDKDISYEIDIKKQIFQEVLDFVEKGGKDEKKVY